MTAPSTLTPPASAWGHVLRSFDPAAHWRPQPKQRRASELAGRVDELLYGGAAGGGKALDLDTPLPTPTGWTTMGEIRVGDELFDENGRRCRVLAATSVQLNRQCYEVEFDDGTVIVADAEHRWATRTASERAQVWRRSEGYRAARRTKRPSRATGRNLRPHVAGVNSARAYAYLPPPPLGIRTTSEIAETLTTGRGVNHSVPLTAALALPAIELPIDPYVLGAWLGDGNSQNGGFTCAGTEILDEIRGAGYQITKWGKNDPSRPYGYGIDGLSPQLRDLGVRGDKHVPEIYQRASQPQRLALLQGLMDTDGSADVDGRVEFCTTSPRLAEDVCELAIGLGLKATLRKGRATLNGIDVGPKFRVTWTATLPVFRLPRKLERLPELIRGVQSHRFIVAVREVPSVPVRCITVDSPSHLYLAGRAMVPTHNTEWLIQYLGEVCERWPNIRCVLFRRVYPSLARSVVPRAKEILDYTGRAKWNANDHTFAFPNGSILELAHLQHEDSVKAHQGTQYVVVAFEELTEFLKSQYQYMLGRLRTATSGIRPHVIATTNPGGKGHAWVKRRFVRPKRGDLRPGQPTPQPGTSWRPAPTVANPRPGVRCFLPATLDDNPALTSADPGYRDRLRANDDRGLRLAYEHGDWDAIDAVDGALWLQSDLDAHRVHQIYVPISRRVVSVDPSDGTEDGDGYGVAVCARGMDKVGYTEKAMEWRGAPGELAQRTVELYRDVRADAVVIERNHGGRWVPAMLYKVDSTVNVVTVWASEGKKTRAEPVASLFRSNPLRDPAVLARLVGEHEDLEAELTSFTGADGDISPNRLDAVVWAMHDLLIGPREVQRRQVEDRRLSRR